MPNDNNAQPIVIDADDISDVPGLPTGDNVDWKAEAEKYQGMATRRGTKLSKLKTQTPPAPTNPNPAPAAQDPKKGELDFAQMAYLNSLGFADAEDHKFIQDSMKETGRDLLATMQSPFVKGELQKMKEERATKAAQAPANSRDGSPAQNEVEYWLNANKLPPADQPALRQKVVNAKIAREKAGGASVFSPNPIIK